MTSATAPFRITGWHVLAGFVAFFGLVIAVDASMMVMAYRSFPGQTSVTPYEDGLAYNATEAQHEAQAALGWSAQIGLTGPRGVAVTINDREGRPVTGLVAAARVQRPATETGAFDVALREVSPGRYAGVTPAMSGAWDIEVTARERSGGKFIVQRRVTAP